MRLPVPEQLLPAEELGRVHFVGIGGAGLSAIATVMAERGLPVTGSDDHDTPFLAQLRALGVPCHLGYAAEQLDEADTVVVTTAAREDNPEVVAARSRGLRMLPRSAALQSVMAGHRVLAVAGTHGKTTTTALLTTALLHCGVDPSYAVGGVPSATGRNAHAGRGDLFVAEADESDGAFLVYRPYGALVTNVEADHLDHFGTEAAYHQAFEDFLGRIVPGGFLVACVDDPGAARLAASADARGIPVLRVGTTPEADLRALDPTFDAGGSRCRVVDATGELGDLRLAVPGRHYLLDALVALAAGLRIGLGFGALADGLATFSGTRRRMELKGTAAGIRVYDSYAHHPNEIAGDLEAARSLAGEGRVVVAFQPHLVSRTRIFGAAMGTALSAADEVVVMDVYVAREDPEPGVDGRLVAAHVSLAEGRVGFEPDPAKVAASLVERARAGDVVLTLGAGDVTEIGPQVLGLLAARDA